LRPLAASFALALAVLAAGCSKSPCQELGEKLCACTGVSKDACTSQVEDRLDNLDPPLTEGRCDDVLATCNAPGNTTFCEWLLTADGKQACGIAPPPTTP
jgi:hypothetical protein